MFIKKKLLLVIVGLMMTCMVFTSCGSKEPCESCGQTPTNDYKNEVTGEKEYYCEDCSSDCAFCSKEADKYYTSGVGLLMFVCDECYDEIEEINNN